MEDTIGIGKFFNIVKAKLTGDLTQVEKDAAESLGERFDSRGIEKFLLGKTGKKRTDALRIMGDAMLLRIFSVKANDVLESLEAARLIFKEGFQPSYDRALSASAALQFYGSNYISEILLMFLETWRSTPDGDDDLKKTSVFLSCLDLNNQRGMPRGPILKLHDLGIWPESSEGETKIMLSLARYENLLAPGTTFCKSCDWKTARDERGFTVAQLAAQAGKNNFHSALSSGLNMSGCIFHSLKKDEMEGTTDMLLMFAKEVPLEVGSEAGPGRPLLDLMETPIVEELKLEDGRIIDIPWMSLAGSRRERATPLHVAALFKKETDAEALLKEGGDPNAKDELGMTPLHWACASGAESLIRVLLKHGADPNSKDSHEDTPLHALSWWSNWGKDGKAERCMRELLGAGADAEARNDRGMTAHEEAFGTDIGFDRGPALSMAFIKEFGTGILNVVGRELLRRNCSDSDWREEAAALLTAVDLEGCVRKDVKPSGKKRI